jgi:hypothetical protein
MSNFDEQLHSRLRALDAAVPAAAADLRRPGGTQTSRRARGVRIAGKLPIGLAAGLVAVIAGAALLGVTLRQQPGTEPAATTAATTASVVPSVSSVTLGSDGIPIRIDDRHVYRVTDQAEWENLSGSFLLAATPGFAPVACIAVQGTGAEGDLLAQFCGGWSLGSTTGSATDYPSFIYAAPKSSPYELLYGWANHAVVLRVHTHDSEAAGCSADKRAACEAAVVVEAVVWPTVPSEINGEQVATSYSDLSTLMNHTGSFLFGGVVSVAPWVPPSGWAPEDCPTSPAEQGLLSDCATKISIAMVPIAPKSNIDAVNGQVVVVRAHAIDLLAFQCSADVLTRCEEAVVVESVVWSSNPYALTMPTPSPPFPTLTPNTSPASTP